MWTLHDGAPGLVRHAATQSLGLTFGTTVLRPTGRTTDGVAFFGEDTIRVLGC